MKNTIIVDQEEYLSLKAKAEKWDKLEDEISKFYPEEIGEEPTGDLCDIGEAAARAFRFM